MGNAHVIALPFNAASMQLISISLYAVELSLSLKYHEFLSVYTEAMMSRKDRLNSNVTNIGAKQIIPEQLESLEIGEIAVLDGKAFMRVENSEPIDDKDIEAE
ncbi:hypothetical protein NQU96_07265 [Pseudoalteromonas elyakovii]|nr:hypothetical protein [Pseudoalteromonas elyakovii]